MNNQSKTDDFFDDSDSVWDTDFEFEEQQADKRQAQDKKHNRKRDARRLLEDHFEKRKLRARNRFIDDYDYSDHFEVY